MCIGSSFSFILERSPDEGPIDDAIIQFGKSVYDGLGKKFTVSIGKEELVEWAKSNLFVKGISTVNDVFNTMLTGIKVGEGDQLAEASVASSITNF